MSNAPKPVRGNRGVKPMALTVPLSDEQPISLQPDDDDELDEEEEGDKEDRRPWVAWEDERVRELVAKVSYSHISTPHLDISSIIIVIFM